MEKVDGKSGEDIYTMSKDERRLWRKTLTIEEVELSRKLQKQIENIKFKENNPEYWTKYGREHRDELKVKRDLYLTDMIGSIQSMYKNDVTDYKNLKEYERIWIRTESVPILVKQCASVAELCTAILNEHNILLKTGSLRVLLRSLPEVVVTLKENIAAGISGIAVDIRVISDSNTIIPKLKQEERRIFKKLAWVEHYGDVCSWCGDRTFECLSLDHVNNDGNIQRDETGMKTSDYAYRIYKETGKWPEDLQSLCRNCNWSKHINGGILPINRKDLYRNVDKLEKLYYKLAKKYLKVEKILEELIKDNEEIE